MMARGSPESRAIVVSAPGTPSPGTVPHSHLKWLFTNEGVARV
ncbi:Hypothetical protein RM25_0858 [Propionibacterium freudenreichii subsp. freudenreichii]|nr:Hypothetical protein RM25_0858 [Propionibacterium freudenreichii subsp. freudenreichii]